MACAMADERGCDTELVKPSVHAGVSRERRHRQRHREEGGQRTCDRSSALLSFFPRSERVLVAFSLSRPFSRSTTRNREMPGRKERVIRNRGSVRDSGMRASG